MTAASGDIDLGASLKAGDSITLTAGSSAAGPSGNVVGGSTILETTGALADASGSNITVTANNGTVAIATAAADSTPTFGAGANAVGGNVTVTALGDANLASAYTPVSSGAGFGTVSLTGSTAELGGATAARDILVSATTTGLSAGHTAASGDALIAGTLQAGEDIGITTGASGGSLTGNSSASGIRLDSTGSNVTLTANTGAAARGTGEAAGNVTVSASGDASLGTSSSPSLNSSTAALSPSIVLVGLSGGSNRANYRINGCVLGEQYGCVPTTNNFINPTRPWRSISLTSRWTPRRRLKDA